MKNDTKKVIKNFAIELIIYGTLVVVYFLVVLQTIGDWLYYLYENNLPVYAIVALVLIVVQGVFLEMVTTFLIERLGLEQLE
jgi:hypothetical protein